MKSPRYPDHAAAGSQLSGHGMKHIVNRMCVYSFDSLYSLLTSSFLFLFFNLQIFGGYLMRLAYELAFCNASVFIKHRPLFLALDEISFRKPVPIGTFLALDSQIVFAEGGDHRSFQVMVKADVFDIQKGTRETTNNFWFTFTNPKQGSVTPKVMPRPMQSRCFTSRASVVGWRVANSRN